MKNSITISLHISHLLITCNSSQWLWCRYLIRRCDIFCVQAGKNLVAWLEMQCQYCIVWTYFSHISLHTLSQFIDNCSALFNSWILMTLLPSRDVNEHKSSESPCRRINCCFVNNYCEFSPCQWSTAMTMRRKHSKLMTRFLKDSSAVIYCCCWIFVSSEKKATS